MRYRLSLTLAVALLVPFVVPGSVAANHVCSDQDPFVYVGGFKDNFGGTYDKAYPSANLINFMTVVDSGPGGVVKYDQANADGRFGDSFYLQKDSSGYPRPICKMKVQYRTQVSTGGASNDALHFGHATPSTLNSGFYFQPAYVAKPSTMDVWTKTISSGNVAALNSVLAGTDGVLDVYLQDDTRIDFVKIWIWYTP